MPWNLIYLATSAQILFNKLTKHRKRNAYSFADDWNIPDKIFYKTKKFKVFLSDCLLKDQERIFIFATEENNIYLQKKTIFWFPFELSLLSQGIWTFFYNSSKDKEKIIPISSFFDEKRIERSYNKLFRTLKDLSAPILRIYYSRFWKCDYKFNQT